MAQTSEESTPTEAAAGTPDPQTPDVVPTTSDAPDTASEQQIGFAADNLNYDGDTEVVVAEGNVQMNREAIEMRADKVIWNRQTGQVRSEEHTSELQSLMRISYAVFCLKKKKIQTTIHNTIHHIQT